MVVLKESSCLVCIGRFNQSDYSLPTMFNTAGPPAATIAPIEAPLDPEGPVWVLRACVMSTPRDKRTCGGIEASCTVTVAPTVPAARSIWERALTKFLSTGFGRPSLAGVII